MAQILRFLGKLQSDTDRLLPAKAITAQATGRPAAQNPDSCELVQQCSRAIIATPGAYPGADHFPKAEVFSQISDRYPLFRYRYGHRQKDLQRYSLRAALDF